MNTPDITEEQAIEILRAADPQERFGFSISRNSYYSRHIDSCLQWSVIATCALSARFAAEQYSVHNLPTLAEAVQEVAGKMSEPASAKAAKLRAQAAALVSQAAQLEGVASIDADREQFVREDFRMTVGAAFAQAEALETEAK